jgi:DNA polymerase
MAIYEKIRLPNGYSTILADMDFETYSEAGFVWNSGINKFTPLKGASKKGISVVGAVVYTEHPSAEVLSLAYNLNDRLGSRLWVPGMPPPLDLFEHIAQRKLIEAWNCSFEFWVWKNICVPKLGWPELPHWILRDAAAKARAFGYPGGLEKAGIIAGIPEEYQKFSEGKRLLNKFSIPRNPTKNNPVTRIYPADDLVDAQKLYEYNLQDIKAEEAISKVCPDLITQEEDFWLCTQAMNIRGVQIDMETVNAAVRIIDDLLDFYNKEISIVTGHHVEKTSEVSKLQTWLHNTHNILATSLNKDTVDRLLSKSDLHPDAKYALELRQLSGSANVKKYYAMQRMTSKAGRAHDLFIYHQAKTGRDGGKDIQSQNLARSGPKLYHCLCGKTYGASLTSCPYCGNASIKATKKGWSHNDVEPAVGLIRTGDFRTVKNAYHDVMGVLAGCVRGMFTAGPGMDLICSDYSSIEAVVTAVLAGEQWRIDAFRRKDDIYLVSAGRIMGRTLEEYVAYKEANNEKHPDRQNIGKPAELGLGFGGWIGAWRQFDSSDNFSDEDVKKNIIAWREASPMIVELWGGQVRGKPWNPDKRELYGLEGAFIAAMYNPGQKFEYRGLSFVLINDVMYGRLPSGRNLVWHKPRLVPSERWEGQVQITFQGWNSNPQRGPIGWITMKTYGGDLCQSFVQATARDIMAHAVVLLEKAGYPIVLRVHDELVAEVPKKFGSIEKFEQIMSTNPPWAKDWPIRAAGGWRGHRYRKD